MVLNEKCWLCGSVLLALEYRMCYSCSDQLYLSYKHEGRLRVNKTFISEVGEPLLFDKGSKYRSYRIATRFSNHYEYYDRYIGSNSEVMFCTDLKAGDRDIIINRGTKDINVDRDAGATEYDSYVLHNSNVDNDLTLSMLFSVMKGLIENNSPLEEICIITSFETMGRLFELLGFGFRDKTVGKMMKDKGFFGFHSYAIVKNIVQDCIARIYFLNVNDQTIHYPKKHAKIRDLQ